MAQAKKCIECEGLTFYWAQVPRAGAEGYVNRKLPCMGCGGSGKEKDRKAAGKKK